MPESSFSSAKSESSSSSVMSEPLSSSSKLETSSSDAKVESSSCDKSSSSVNKNSSNSSEYKPYDGEVRKADTTDYYYKYDEVNGKGCGWEAECSPTYPVRGICPEGWHLPDTTEWNALFDAVGGKETAGIMLKSTEGWDDNGNGSDTYFFSALPVGRRDINGKFDDEDEGGSAAFWSSTEDNSFHAYGMFLYYNYDNASLYNDGKYHGLSVRCLKDLQAE